MLNYNYGFTNRQRIDKIKCIPFLLENELFFWWKRDESNKFCFKFKIRIFLFREALILHPIGREKKNVVGHIDSLWSVYSLSMAEKHERVWRKEMDDAIVMHSQTFVERKELVVEWREIIIEKEEKKRGEDWFCECFIVATPIPFLVACVFRSFVRSYSIGFLSKKKSICEPKRTLEFMRNVDAAAPLRVKMMLYQCDYWV